MEGSLTKIGIVYFKEKLSKNRAHHEVNDLIMSSWIHFYERSGTTLEPCLITDGESSIPKQWKYDVAVSKDPDPPQRYDVLNKVGWLKAQGHKIIGKCIIMDMDCFIMKSIDDIGELDCKMAMPVDEGHRTYDDWLEVGEELNAGCMFFNSSEIYPQFLDWWFDKTHYLKSITYFDELIFSAICRGLNGQILSSDYNRSWPVGDNAALEEATHSNFTKILHFHGERKSQLKQWAKKNRIKI